MDPKKQRSGESEAQCLAPLRQGKPHSRSIFKHSPCRSSQSWKGPIRIPKSSPSIPPRVDGVWGATCLLQKLRALWKSISAANILGEKTFLVLFVGTRSGISWCSTGTEQSQSHRATAHHTEGIRESKPTSNLQQSHGFRPVVAEE